jgi:tyrosyl-tRNA synthetase
MSVRCIRGRLALADEDLRDGQTIGLVDLVAMPKLVTSKSEARRLIIQGGVEVDGEKQSDAMLIMTILPGTPY